MIDAIRQLHPDDFEELFAIWELGSREAFSNQALDSVSDRQFNRSFFKDALSSQDQNFKFWGWEEDGNLLGWQSLLPCQSAPTMWNKFAESSTYIKPDMRGKGIGRALLEHAIDHAREKSDLAYILGYVSEVNTHVEQLITEVGFQKVGVIPKSSKDLVCGSGSRHSKSVTDSSARITVWVVSL